MNKRNVIITILSVLILVCLFAFARDTTTDLGLVKPTWEEESPEYNILVDLNANMDILEALANDPLEFDTGERLEDRAGAMWTGNTETLITFTYQDGDNTVDAVVEDDLDLYDNTTSAFITTTLTENEVEAYIFDADAETILGNWVNITYPWADNEVADDITINLAALATTFTATDNENEALACLLVFIDGATGAQGAETDGDLTYNPSTGKITATGFVGALTGNADTVTTNANLTGVVTSTGNATAIADKAIAIAKLADGTDGELITWDASGVIATVPVGTATHVLTSGGTGVAPTFQATGGGYTNLTSFVEQTAWRVFYSNTAGDVTELALGADGTYLKSNGAAAAPSFAVPAGAGDVSKVGTPANSQVGVWTGDGTIEGAASLTYDGSNLLLTGDIGKTDGKITKGWFTDLVVTNAIAGSVTGNAATVTSFTPASGSLTLSGADALTLTTTAATNVTLPTTGTLATLSEAEVLSNKNLTDIDILNFADATELIIATGAITITQTYHKIDTEGDAASDDLATISGGTAGDVIYLCAENDARTVVLKHDDTAGAGKIVTSDGEDYSLDDDNKVVTFVYNSVDSHWHMIGAAGGGGAGETNTASNIGSQVEIYKQKDGVDLEFRTLKADSNKIIVTIHTEGGAIDVGLAAINRATTVTPAWTVVDKENPANETGIITSIEIWADSELLNCEVATFFVVSGNNLSTRDTEVIGTVPAGSKQTFNVSLNVQAGDYIGLYASSGQLDMDAGGSLGGWGSSGDKIPCTNSAFSLYNNWELSLYGTGTTAILDYIRFDVVSLEVAKEIGGLLSTTTIAFNADADTTLYTVPMGKRCVLSHAIIVAAADAGGTTTLSIGANGAETDFIPANTLSNLDAQYDSVILQPIPNTTPLKLKSYAAATVIEAQVASQSGAAGNTIYLFGILY